MYKHDETDDRIDMYVGGAFQAISEVPTSRSVVGLFDAKEETDNIWRARKAAGLHNSNFRTFALVPGETLHGLVERIKSDGYQPRNQVWLDEMKKRPNTHLETGLGQEKLCGHHVQIVAVSQGLLIFLENLYSEFFVRWNGIHGNVQIRAWAGLSGGTGPDVGRQLASRMSDLIISKSGQITTISLIRIGAFSYEGLGDRIWKNASAGLFEDLVWVLSPRAQKKEIRRLTLVELPTVSSDGTAIGTDKLKRDTLATQLNMAISSPDLNRVFNSLDSNLDTSELGYGTVRLLQADWWHTISPLHITFSAAHFYKSQLERNEFTETTSSTENLGIPHVNVEVYPNKEHLRSAQDTAESVLSEPIPSRNDLECVAKTIRSFEAQVVIEYHGQTCQESIIQALEQPRSVGDYAYSLRHFSAVVQALEDRLESYRTEQTAAENELRDAERSFHTALDLWYPIGAASRMKSAFYSTSGKLNTLEQAISQYRCSAEKCAEIESSISALEGLLLTERRRLDDYHNRPKLLKEDFSQILAESIEPDQLIHSDWFQFRNLDLVFAELLSKRGDIQVLRRWLSCQSCEYVTSKGLAKIVGCDADSSLHEIKNALFDRDPEYRGPYWGGAEPVDKPVVTIIVTPPLSPSTSKELPEIMQHKTARCDSFVAGANIMVLKLYEVSLPWQVLTKPYLHTIRTMEVKEDPRRFFIDWDALMSQDRWRELYESLCKHYKL